MNRTGDDAPDPIFRSLGRLPSAAPSDASGDRVRARCHALLARRVQPTSLGRRRGGLLPMILNTALGAAACAYFVEVVREAVRLRWL